MTNEGLGKISEDIENHSDEGKAPKNLCVHELKRRLKNKQKKENVNIAIILFIMIFIIGFLLLLIY
mgnify:FL=1